MFPPFGIVCIQHGLHFSWHGLDERLKTFLYFLMYPMVSHSRYRSNSSAPHRDIHKVLYWFYWHLLNLLATCKGESDVIQTSHFLLRENKPSVVCIQKMPVGLKTFNTNTNIYIPIAWLPKKNPLQHLSSLYWVSLWLQPDCPRSWLNTDTHGSG